MAGNPATSGSSVRERPHIRGWFGAAVGGFDPIYREGDPPWDIGRPQPEVVRLETSGRIEGSVLDVGCGTGENALYLAGRGHPVVGVDAAPTAIARAREKATVRRVHALFHVADALDLDPGRGSFRTVLDCGLFHTFEDADRPRYARSLGRVAHPGARLIVLCFSDREPPGWGPRRIREAELREAFGPEWAVEAVERARFETKISPAPVHAWCAEYRRR